MWSRQRHRCVVASNVKLPLTTTRFRNNLNIDNERYGLRGGIVGVTRIKNIGSQHHSNKALNVQRPQRTNQPFNSNLAINSGYCRMLEYVYGGQRELETRRFWGFLNLSMVILTVTLLDRLCGAGLTRRSNS